MIQKKYQVTIIGSGNWGSVAAKLIASNTLKLNSFHDEVRMWVFEETLPNGEKLTDIINKTNENVKYLPGITLGSNVVADPDLEHAVKDANMLVFVTPHQFMEGICKRLVGKIKGDAEAISLIKGMEVNPEGPQMISSLISKQLGVNCCVLMGANIANEIALQKFSEATVGYKEDEEVAQRWVQIFGTPYFHVSAVRDVEGVELCGTLKNVVAIAAGFVDGLEMGNNTKWEEETEKWQMLLQGAAGRGLSTSSKQSCCMARNYREYQQQKKSMKFYANVDGKSHSRYSRQFTRYALVVFLLLQ
ncbi:glycerol-3-phosphate dehydrogenase [NAD(+)] 1, chloroplastic-like isoform X3 [Papaver somniferum]|uniref:glycerol-3-phosphate dehydrogenase [NAD(+)] 1, chloroplastic-like isoform X3 n=1 Tax=Papaver somniferum TaxID=3469 RepID=UPI000E6FF14D|nr:glycerol-3-phosphate dehydrogenase [NAD(+)] 1, chloroplastic-like isoform X3 [Papaver somniferum]